MRRDIIARIVSDQNLLSGIRVIDCGTYIAAPAAAVIMSDFGAEVIKIERPPYGDPYRYLSRVPGMPVSDVGNVETVLGSEADPKLPANALDLVLLVDVYHEFSQPQEMLQHIRAALKPSGRLVLLEYRKEDPAVPIRPDHKMSVVEVKTEVEAEGYRLDKVIETLPRQHIIIFKKLSM